MRMTWVPVPVPDEEAFEAIKAGVDTLPPGSKMMLNAGIYILPQAGELTVKLTFLTYQANFTQWTAQPQT